MTEVESVLAFWFEPRPDTEEQLNVKMRQWFMGGETLDRQIRGQFGPLVERARRGELDAWSETPHGTLALIILLDQFSRNLYRGSAEAFSADAKALELTRNGADAGRFATFDALELLFACMPFTHAEDLESQKRGAIGAQRVALSVKPEWKKAFLGSVDFARKHLDVIARFGRFPHRNAALGRASTPEELEYLEYCKFAGTWL
jgi:uncharacterized protein (DUF924 family)